jgi:hypothetical protein
VGGVVKNFMSGGERKLENLVFFLRDGSAKTEQPRINYVFSTLFTQILELFCTKNCN